MTVAATIVDDESSVDDLTYIWAARSGVITGTGRSAKWKAPLGEPTPATYKISLTVIDRYASGEQSLEHRVSAESSEIHVNDSPKEVRALSEQFMRDFANSSLSPETCVRNFSDSCRGKAIRARGHRRQSEAGSSILSHTFPITRVRCQRGSHDRQT